MLGRAVATRAGSATISHCVSTCGRVVEILKHVRKVTARAARRSRSRIDLRIPRPLMAGLREMGVDSEAAIVRLLDQGMRQPPRLEKAEDPQFVAQIAKWAGVSRKDVAAVIRAAHTVRDENLAPVRSLPALTI